MKKIFPKEILDNTIEAHHSKYKTKSKIIYTSILTAIVIALAALPFIKVDVYTTSSGIISPIGERVQLSLTQGGEIVALNIKNNQTVHKGDTLLIINDFSLDNDKKLVSYKTDKNEAFLKDVTYLLRTNHPKLGMLKTAKYKRDFLQYRQKCTELNTKLVQKEKYFTRNIGLFEKGVIAESKFEKIKLAYELALSAVSQYKKQKLGTWQIQSLEYTNTLEKLGNQVSQIERSKTLYVLIAPTTGTVLSLKGIKEGGFLTAGEVVAEISPKTNLIAECYVSPKDIGLLQSDREVVFQVHAYNYNQWGMASGSIKQISKDVLIVNQEPVFKVTCKIDQAYLKLKSGFKGNLKKGMTLTAKFKLAERSLFHLLYDDVNDWLNPAKG